MKQIPENVLTGGLTGQGFINLLGRPRLGALALVLREAVQNSWDARKRTGLNTLRFWIRLRTLKPTEDAAFRKSFAQDETLEPTRRNTLARELRTTRAIRVLELADFGTVGLSGATRPDLPTGGSESRFVNFFFDVGRAHEESGDGGTYGFGRSSLYTAGKASTIVVDSLVSQSAGTERRLMACRIGESFEVNTGRGKGRYSGRHFWGNEKSGIAQPLVGSTATTLAERLGMPNRNKSTDTGTTILIPWPVSEFDSGPDIARTLLHHLWPKMVPSAGNPTVAFDVEVEGRRHEVANPAKSEEYRLFAQALKIARTKANAGGARDIQTLRPRHTTGYLGIISGVLRVHPATPKSINEDEEEDEIEESPLNHIALMRPSELVVKYLPVSGTEQPGKSWAGVFVCDNADAVRNAFARAEPPAHDDWIVDRLTDKTEKYIVRKTVQSLLPSNVREALGIGQTGNAVEPATGPSLAAASGRFSSLLLSGDGQGPSRQANERSPSTARRRGDAPAAGGPGRRMRVSAPVPLGVDFFKGIRVARFRTTVYGTQGEIAVIRATSAIHADGTLDTPPEGIVPPSILRWIGGVARGDLCEVTLESSEKEIQIDVAFHGDYGITLDCVIEETKA